MKSPNREALNPKEKRKKLRTKENQKKQKKNVLRSHNPASLPPKNPNVMLKLVQKEKEVLIAQMTEVTPTTMTMIIQVVLLRIKFL